MTEWEVLEALDPWGQKRDDHRFALLASVIANASGSKHPTGRFWISEDFLLHFVETKPLVKHSVSSMERSLVSWARAHNAMLAEKKRRKA